MKSSNYWKVSLQRIKVLLLILCFPFNLYANKEMKPMKNELLDSPIKLECSNISIVEWRKSRNKPWTEVNKKSIKYINKICDLSYKLLPSYLKNNKINIKSIYVDYKISMMPWDAFGNGKWMDGEGAKYRNLNDIRWRFKNRTMFFDENGKMFELLGYTERNINFIFLRNDVLTKDYKLNYDFVEIFAHELFHAVSDYNGLYKSLGVNKDSADEKLANNFGIYIRNLISEN